MMTWGSMFFQNPGSFMMEMIVCMHDYVMMFLLSTMILVLLSLLKSYRSKSFDLFFFEEHQLETVWTILPFILLLTILVPSLTSLYMLDTCNFCGLSISVVAHQWYWTYYYNDLKDFAVDSYMLNSDSTDIRLLDVDNRIFLASFIPTRFLVSSADVIHSWTVPSFGFKMDAVPGRINQFCVTPKRSGIFFGQCSEICGANHSFMPIVLESISLKDLMKTL